MKKLTSLGLTIALLYNFTNSCYASLNKGTSAAEGKNQNLILEKKDFVSDVHDLSQQDSKSDIILKSALIAPVPLGIVLQFVSASLTNTLPKRFLLALASVMPGILYFWRNSNNFAREATFGGYNQGKYKDFTKQCSIEKIKTENLIGRIYRYKNVSEDLKFKGKTIIVYPGRAMDAEQSLDSQSTAKFFLENGADTVLIDRRGQGKNESKGLVIGENTIFEDSWNIYRYMVDKKKVKPENVILYGFSLGGASAAYVASKAAEKNEKILGLCFQSSIDSISGATIKSVNTTNFPKVLGRLLAPVNRFFTASKMDVIEHLKHLYEKHANIRIIFISGKTERGDFLALSETKLDIEAKKIGFKKVEKLEFKRGHIPYFGKSPKAIETLKTLVHDRVVFS
ncbi:MAG: alpha/beta hydrolase [Oscillospiraceae bacterium]|jgi:hypothetical protein|nr:alpha/beta hydrolase [Oscillospiraceae bacterium]